MVYEGPPVREHRSLAIHLKDGSRADSNTESTVVAEADVEFQCDCLLDVAQRTQGRHLPSRYANQAAPATAAAAACKGSARRISNSTPEGEVIGDEPVKFIPV